VLDVLLKDKGRSELSEIIGDIEFEIKLEALKIPKSPEPPGMMGVTTAIQCYYGDYMVILGVILWSYLTYLIIFFQELLCI